MLKSGFNLWLILIMLFVFCCTFIACGGEDQNSDGDTDQTTDGDTDDESTQTKTIYEGMWQLNDTNALNWFKANDLATFYFISEKENEFVFLMVDKAGETYCVKQAMTENEERFVPQLDPDNCWYEIEKEDLGDLIIESRNRSDPDTVTKAWYFSFSKVEEIDQYDYNQCNILDECTSYFVE